MQKNTVKDRERKTRDKAKNVVGYNNACIFLFPSFSPFHSFVIASRLIRIFRLPYGTAKERRMTSLQQPHRQVFLVTGANKGIGYEVVKKLSAKHPKDLILLGSRDQNRGEEARTKLGSPSNVKVLVLDVTSKESIERAKEEVQKTYGGYLDVIINNAGVAGSEPGLKSLKDTFDTNFYGMKQMNDTMSPLLRDNGRIVNVSSGAGILSMRHCSDDLKAKFLRPDLREAELVQLFSP